jgi:hypothetical protein
MYGKEEGQVVDRAELATRIRDAVAGVVAKQKEAVIDNINDGEMSKPSYATYVKDRLSGFGGTGNTFVYQDLVDFPNLAKRVFGDPGRSRRKTPACNGPIAFHDIEAVQTDIENLASAIGAREGGRAFISAASPGVISLFFRNDYYSSEDVYLEAIATAMQTNMKPSSQPVSICRSTALIWRWVDIFSMQAWISLSFANGRPSTSRRLITRSETSLLNECACMYVGATTKVRTTTMFLLQTSWTLYSQDGLLPSRSRPRIHVTLTNGHCSRR